MSSWYWDKWRKWIKNKWKAIVSSLENIFKNKKLHISNDNIYNDDDFYSDEHCPIVEKEFDRIKDNLVYFITVVQKKKMRL